MTATAFDGAGYNRAASHLTEVERFGTIPTNIADTAGLVTALEAELDALRITLVSPRDAVTAAFAATDTAKALRDLVARAGRVADDEAAEQFLKAALNEARGRAARIVASAAPEELITALQPRHRELVETVTDCLAATPALSGLANAEAAVRSGLATEYAELRPHLDEIRQVERLASRLRGITGTVRDRHLTDRLEQPWQHPIPQAIVDAQARADRNNGTPAGLLTGLAAGGTRWCPTRSQLEAAVADTERHHNDTSSKRQQQHSNEQRAAQLVAVDGLRHLATGA